MWREHFEAEVSNLSAVGTFGFTINLMFIFFSNVWICFKVYLEKLKENVFFLLAVMSLSLPNKFVLAQEKYPLCHICYFLTKKEGFKLLFPARQTLPLDQETSAIIPHLFFFFEKKRWHDDLQQAPSWFYKLLKKEIKHQDAMNFVQYKNCVWICWIKLF